MLDDLRHFDGAARERIRGFARGIVVGAIAGGLLAAWWCKLGHMELEAARVTEARVLEVEGARRAPADGGLTLFAGDPRELHRLVMIPPLGCFPPTGEWIRSWGDGQSPYESDPETGRRPWKCVNADLRRSPHASPF